MMSASSVTPGMIARLVAGLRFPQLFVLVATVLVVDLLIPDLIPFADEILLGLLTVLLGSLKRPAADETPREVKDVTPPARGSTGEQ